MFVQLHWHSTYSFLEAIGTISSIVEEAKSLGMSAIGLTDYHWLYGAIDFYKKARAYSITPLVGVDMPFIRTRSVAIKRSQSFWYLSLLAKNFSGYQQLLSLVSRAHASRQNGIPFVDFRLLEDFCQWDSLYVFFGWLSSFVACLLNDGVSTDIIKEYVWFLVSVFWVNNVLIELVVRDYSLDKRISVLDEFLLTLATDFWLRVFASSNFHYVCAADKSAYELALCIKDGKKIYDEDRRKVIGDQHIMSEKEIVQVLQSNGFSDSRIVTYVNCSGDVFSCIDLSFPLGATLFPEYQTPSDISALYERYHSQLVQS